MLTMIRKKEIVTKVEKTAPRHLETATRHLWTVTRYLNTVTRHLETVTRHLKIAVSMVGSLTF